MARDRPAYFEWQSRSDPGFGETVSCHAEQGEERFTVEYDVQTEEVWYDLFAFSRPRDPLARFGYPFSRHLQKRFARESLAAMKRAASVPPASSPLPLG